MPDSDEKKELDGVARSIAALFSDFDVESTEEVSASPADAEPIQDSFTAPADAELEAPLPNFLDLAGGSAEEGESPEELTWKKVPEESDGDPEPAVQVDADPDALASVIDTFLSTPILEREGQATEIRVLAAALRDANALDPLANAVERLVLEAGDDEASLALARLMVTAGVANRFVARLSTERDEERRAQLMQVCSATGNEMAIAISDALSDTSDRFAHRTLMGAMVSMGAAGMSVIEQMIEDDRWFVVRNGLAILGDVGGEHAVELVTSSLANTDARVRKEALLALAKIGGEGAGMLVCGMLEDPDAEARLAAAMAAGALKVERALKPLLRILDGEDDVDVTIGVVRALGQIGDPGAVNLIEKRAVVSFFSRPPVEVRIVAYRALLSIGTPHARKLVEQAADDKDPEVKRIVRDLLAGQ